MARRTGLRTLHVLLRRVCELTARYGDMILAVLPQQYHVYLLAVMQACDDFVLNVPVGEILGDETP